MNAKTIKFIGVAASVFGTVLSMVGNWAAGKQQDIKIAEAAAEAVSKIAKGES